MFSVLFFFKRKTAYELRISDWSSDVCSSDLPRAAVKQNPLLQFVSNGSLVVQILIGLVAGVVLALLSPTSASWVGIVGDLFVNALKAVAPILVFILVAASKIGRAHV